MIRKIPLTIAPSFWVLAAIISWASSDTAWQFLAWICVVVVSVVVHELGHALAARVWGQGAQITLGPLGGTTTYGGSPMSRTKEFLVILCGPCFGYILAGISLVLYRSGFQPAYFLQALFWANIVWSTFNLLPVHPFDGGKLMSILFDGLFGVVGLRLSYLLSGIFAILLSAFFISNNYLFAGALLLLCAFESFRSWQQRHYFQTTASEKLLDHLAQAEEYWHENQPQKAISELEDLMKKTKEGEIYERAVARLADFLAATGETKKAYHLLHSQKTLQGDALKLYQLLCYKQGLWRESLEAGNRIFREVHDASCAIMNAFSAAHLQDVKTAINWLTTVKNAKTVDMQSILSAEDFDTIRSDASFLRFVTSCK